MNLLILRMRRSSLFDVACHSKWIVRSAVGVKCQHTQPATAAIIGAARHISGLNLWEHDLSTEIKHKIEKHWKNHLYDRIFDESSEREKCYILSMFPYPSGQLHMGHVRVYSISDAVARFYRMNGKNVLHPMGWDAFGLPAENAALDRGINPDDWTEKNIGHMKEQMEELSLSFDWNREVATCDPDYYKWTQFLFLRLYEAGLVYQSEALVNWDPVDMTVLAEEQVDESGRSWRSGAKVEKKRLRQWFIRTTRFSKQLLDGLNDPELRDWRDIIKLQKHWIGECDGTTIDFEILSGDTSIACLPIWIKQPEFIENARFVAVKPGSMWTKVESVKNPFTTNILPVYITEDVDYAKGVDCHLGIPDLYEPDKIFAENNRIPEPASIKNMLSESELLDYRYKIKEEARNRQIGGYDTSSNLRDWLISRQRYWGTPIPMIHCEKCGKPVPVPEEQLPVVLPKMKKISRQGLSPLLEAKDWLNVNCPKCGGPARRETDTMDTFVDSSWYFLRFLDPDNLKMPFDPLKAEKFMPVDVYVGGKEHAVLHLYYARFFGHFLHSAGLIPQPEPFKRLLVQGMVRGKTFRIKGSGEYIHPDNVELKGKNAFHKETKAPLVISWEKMSKSKFNGVDPLDMFREFGSDTTRLILLADVAPTSSRNWSRDTFPGILKWQHRLWLTMQNFIKIRNDLADNFVPNEQFEKEDAFLFDSRNFYIRGASFNFLTSHQLSVGISKMQGLTNSIRKSSQTTIGRSLQYERALAAQIVLLAPIAPHFASELWAGFISAKNRICNTGEIIWDRPVLHQPWPRIDSDYCLDLFVKVNNTEVTSLKVPTSDLNELKHSLALGRALKQEAVIQILQGRDISSSSYKLIKDYEAVLNIVTARLATEQVNEETGEDLNLEKMIKS